MREIKCLTLACIAGFFPSISLRVNSLSTALGFSAAFGAIILLIYYLER